jgi:glutathione S-transferase
MTRPILHCFRASHFNEKAHWALDWKGLAYDVVEHWPGPHAPAIRKLTGETQTPVLEWGGEVIGGSTEILHALDRWIPARPLFPEDPGERRACIETIAWFDDELGPAVRLALFHELLPDLDSVSRIFVREPWGLRERLYRAALPAIRAVMKKAMQIDADGARAGRMTTRQALDRVAEAARRGPYLVGDRFTAADLTAAALLSITAYPKGFHAELPEGLGPAMGEWIDAWQGDAGVRWVEGMYARHRSRPARPT